MNIKDKIGEIWDSLPNSDIEPNHRQEIVKQNVSSNFLFVYMKLLDAIYINYHYYYCSYMHWT